MEFEIKAFAKINLGLRVGRVRDDGYHEIETIFQLIDLCDTLTFKNNHNQIIQIICSDPAIPLNHENLITRSILFYQKEMNVEGGVEVTLEKRIPAGGGLGGGSSDAAAALRACERLWGLNSSEEKLHRMAIEIGSDVPFFLKGGTALGEGRGEKLTPLESQKSYWIVLVCPGFSISTGWAYSQTRIALTNAQKIGKLSSLFCETDVHTWRETLVNELESVVFERHPELQEIKRQLYARDAFYAGMSGSGSTMYGLFHDRTVAESAVAFFSKSSSTALLARPISGDPTQELLFAKDTLREEHHEGHRNQNHAAG